MRVLIAPQEFKGCLTAPQVAVAMAVGVRRVDAGAEIDSAPLGDGGPGTVEALVRAGKGRVSYTSVEGPLGAPVYARWGRIAAGRTAVLEMAAAVGLALVPAARRDVRRAGTTGVGELITAALDAGVERILMGVGGSATNDGGAGMATALGARFLDDAGHALPPGGAALARLARIDVAAMDARLRAVEIVALVDVLSPLLGPEGASSVFSPQKGADAATVAELERALTNLADICARDLDVDLRPVLGAGAGGGLAGGLVVFTGARIARGIAAVAGALDLPARVRRADLVLTGEGRLDAQSAAGKAVAGVCALAAAAARPCLVVAGEIADQEIVRAFPGLSGAAAASPPGATDAEILARAPALIADSVEGLLQRHVRPPDEAGQ